MHQTFINISSKRIPSSSLKIHRVCIFYENASKPMSQSVLSATLDVLTNHSHLEFHSLPVLCHVTSLRA